MTTSEDGFGATGTQQEAATLLGSEVRDGYAEIGDQRLHYVEAGEGPLIVLLHGFPYDVHSYAEVAPRLGALGYRAIVPYLRGHGPTRFLDDASPRPGPLRTGHARFPGNRLKQAQKASVGAAEY